MSSLPEEHRRALDATGRIVRGIDPRHLEESTPCENFDVRDLLNHLVSGNLWVEPLVSGKTIDEVGDRYDGDVVGDDPSAAYDASAQVAGDAFARPGAMETPVAVSYGPVPGEIYAGHRFIDVLIHGWDLAVATGQDATLDPDLVETCWKIVRPQEDLLRGSGAFGTEVEVPDDADSQTRLLAVLGRRVPF
ncbi:MAG TPA: TIGR03086 family metal-binding protein [Acidimicrobiales bacterium]|nr:TIGR03086 family metal-binding protein [Acidimicrobiales bacterium]